MLCINEGIKKTGRFRQNNFNVSFRLLDAEGDGVSSPVVVNGKQYVGAKVKRQPLIFHGLRSILRKSGAVFLPAFSSTLWYSVETGCIAAFGEMFRFERGWTAAIKRIHYRSDLINELRDV